MRQKKKTNMDKTAATTTTAQKQKSIIEKNVETKYNLPGRHPAPRQDKERKNKKKIKSAIKPTNNEMFVLFVTDSYSL